MQRILFVSSTANWIGPTISLLLLLKHLRSRYDVTVLLPGESFFCEALDREDIPYFSFRSIGKRSIPAIFRLIRREGFDLVYGNTINVTSRNALIAAKLAGVPFICNVREMGWENTWLQTGFLRFSNAVIAVSQACADSISRFVPQVQLRVVHNGVSASLCRFSSGQREAARSALLAETGLAPDTVIIVSLAHILARKRQEYAVEAMVGIVKSIPATQLLLVGKLDGNRTYVNKIRAMIQDKGLGTHVSLLGFRQDALHLVQGADILLHTAVQDAHPRAVIEAMAIGLPVVAFDVDGASESVKDGKTGYLIPPGDVPQIIDAVLRLVSDPSLRATMGRMGRRRVETQFSAAAMAEKVAEVIDGQLALPTSKRI